MITTPFLVLALLATPQPPEVKPVPPAVAEFEKTLNATKYQWAKDKDGDYKIELIWEEEKRTQVVFIRGGAPVELKAGDALGGAKREVWSICWKSSSPPDAEKMAKLLTTHYKLGGFQLEKTESGKWTAYYHVDIPDNASPGFVRQAIRISAEAADEMEKGLLGTDDF